MNKSKEMEQIGNLFDNRVLRSSMSINVLTGESLFDQGRVVCPECGAKNTTMIAIGSTRYHRCWSCEHKWETCTNKNE